MDIKLFSYDPTGSVKAENEVAQSLLNAQRAGSASGSLSALTLPFQGIIDRVVAVRTAVGMVVTFLGLAFLISVIVNVVRAIVGSPMDTWDWWDPFWAFPIAMLFMWGGVKIAGED